MPDITPDTLALIAGAIAAALVVQPPPPAPAATTNGTVDTPTGTDPIPVNPPTVEPDADPALVAIAQKSVLLARLIGDEVQRTEPVDVPAPLPWGRETRLPT